MKTILNLVILISIYSSSLFSQNSSLQNYKWNSIITDENLVGRHECAFFEYKGKFYLLGGRGVNPVNVYDPTTNKWGTKGLSPIEIHHFQPVVYGNAIILAGAMTGPYPTETPLENIYLYYPEEDRWEKGPEIPLQRRRGSAGAVLCGNKIYLLCGIQLGHTSGTCPWADSYDLKTGRWEALSDAPHIRDHFPAICVDGKIYCAGGRNTSVHEEKNFAAFFSATINEVDCYDIQRNKWVTLNEKLPVGTAAGSIAYFKDRILYIGGESGQDKAHNETQSFDPKTGNWEMLSPLQIGRHGTGAIVFNDKLYIAAGSGNRGGGNMKSMECFNSDLNPGLH